MSEASKLISQCITQASNIKWMVKGLIKSHFPEVLIDNGVNKEKIIISTKIDAHLRDINQDLDDAFSLLVILAGKMSENSIDK